MTNLLASWAAFLAVLGALAAIACAHAAWHGWRDYTKGQRVGLLAIAAVSLAIGMQQTRAVIAYEIGTWTGNDQWLIVAIGHRLLLSGGMLAFCWVATHRRCGHRGWQAMAAAGLVAWAASWAF